MDPTPKPGYATTEFWVTLGNELLAFVLAILAVSGHVLPDNARAVVLAAAPVAAALGGAYYSWSRSRVKQTVLAIAGAAKAQTAEHVHQLGMQEKELALQARLHGLKTLTAVDLSEIITKLDQVIEQTKPKPRAKRTSTAR